LVHTQCVINCSKSNKLTSFNKFPFPCVCTDLLIRVFSIHSLPFPAQYDYHTVIVYSTGRQYENSNFCSDFMSVCCSSKTFSEISQNNFMTFSSHVISRLENHIPTQPTNFEGLVRIPKDYVELLCVFKYTQSHMSHFVNEMNSSEKRWEMCRALRTNTLTQSVNAMNCQHD